MWLSIQVALISAITAAVVTVVLEYAFKPKLEARKDRVISLEKMADELRVQLHRAVEDVKYLSSRRTETKLKLFHVDVVGCEHKARAISSQRRQRNRIHAVLAALSASRHRLEALLDAPRKPSSDEEMQQIAHDLYFAASRFLFRRQSQAGEWLRLRKEQYDKSKSTTRMIG